MRKIISLLNIAAFLTILSCHSEIDNTEILNPPTETMDTIMEITIPDLAACMDSIKYLSSCDSYINLDEEKYCDPVYIGQFQFSETSIDLANLFCDQHSKIVLLANTIGDTISLEATDFFHYYGNITNRFTLPCESDTSKNLLQCYNTERFRVRYEFKKLDIKFHINLFIKTRNNINNQILDFDALEIWEKTSSTTFGGRMKIIINSRHSQINAEDPSFFHDTLELNNIIYYDVYYNKDLGSSSSHVNKYYLTLDQGIVAIKTEDGTVYTLVE